MATTRPNTSDQDVIPDVADYYNKIIVKIDRFRSRFNINTANIEKNFFTDQVDNIFVDNEMNSLDPQESRCNAFYRMIGFPVVNGEGTDLYSPGHDPDLNRDSVRQNRNNTIATSLLKSLKPILDGREIIPRVSANIFQNQDVNSSLYAIASVFVRSFDRQFKPNVGALKQDSQAFQIPDREVFEDDVAFIRTGNPTKTGIPPLSSSTHILKPFVVDPRIELTVTPAANRICAPFLADKSKTQLTKGQYLKRPYIEHVIRVRFSATNILISPTDKPEIDQYVQDLIAQIKSDTTITDQSLITAATNPLESLYKSELDVFKKFDNMLKAFIKELVNSINEIGRIQTTMNWKPIPDVRGPEFGSTLSDIDPNDPSNQKKEIEIHQLEIDKVLNTTDLNIGLNDPDVGDYNFSDIDDVAISSEHKNPEFYDKKLTTLTRQRNESGNKANEALKKIEIITGEFSGLGLLDIIAIQAALWIISQEALLGLIDDAAVDRMQNDENLKSNITKLPAIDALTEFEEKLSGIYFLIGFYYRNNIDANGKNE